MKNLAALGEAIKAYRADHKDVPNWLSDLVPKYLKDPNVLVCPLNKKTGEVSNLGMNDPRIATSYTYQFSEAPIPRSLYSGPTHTMKEWKRRQMSLVGSKVPMIRCHHHTPFLNLAFDGRIYESSRAWEADLKDEIDPKELTATRIFGKEAAALAVARLRSELPKRDTNTPANLIDLSSHYNASLSDAWYRQRTPSTAVNDLSWLPRGLQKFAETEFDVRGIVQLSSKKLNDPRFPESVKAIKVGRKTPRLHFLHGVNGTAPEGTPVATFTMHYSNGTNQDLTLAYGTHVLNWLRGNSEPKDKKVTVVAWTGKSPASEGKTLLRLYKTSWTNPLPEDSILSLDYLSSNADAAPFLIAITAE